MNGRSDDGIFVYQYTTKMWCVCVCVCVCVNERSDGPYVTALQNAVAEMRVLSLCDELVGSYGSSFSAVAASWRGERPINIQYSVLRPISVQYSVLTPHIFFISSL